MLKVKLEVANCTVHNKAVHFPLCPNDNEQVCDVYWTLLV